MHRGGAVNYCKLVINPVLKEPIAGAPDFIHYSPISIPLYPPLPPITSSQHHEMGRRAQDLHLLSNVQARLPRLK